MKWSMIFSFLVCHLIAVLAIFPWFFSWTAVVLLVAGFFVFGTLGINVGYHRLLTHRGFSSPLWLEHTLVIFGVCALQDAPAIWVATHRKHHHFPDDEHDPHSPIVSFFWAHMGWLCVKADAMKRGLLIDRYAKDILRDPLYPWISKKHRWLLITFLSWVAIFGAGFGSAALWGGSLQDAAQFGLSLVVWGAALRTVIYWHLTWSVNSVTHIWGYRNYDTPDLSRNNLFLGLLTSGEGWHNNHHADPRSARHGHKWWEVDLSWLFIRFLMALRLAKNVVVPSPILAAKFNARGSSGFTAPQTANSRFGSGAALPATSADGPVVLR
jgi:fatty-acid desaturase